MQDNDYIDAKYFPGDMLPHEDDLASNLDRRVIARWTYDNLGSRRVHYPHSQMGRAGFMLIIDDESKVLLMRRKTGIRSGYWGLHWRRGSHVCTTCSCDTPGRGTDRAGF